MSKIQLDTEELDGLKMAMHRSIDRIKEVSSGGYVTENLFNESQGASADSLSQCLAVLVKCSNQMEGIIGKTSLFLEEIIEGFTEVDSTSASKINSHGK
ncbi:hypothetical protein [Candidatus Enterococcus clewellii]|uniref:LXG domain-containing protein n=1 Tax=Candidatus Enterococcus clewellii TaxID=1834193 RepID=A0A242KBC4_9ENTE|nr:hypothetical protein [Enterococcus sp. 9E7_DIV0242]OTP18475.1 hypothetical protein A5888_000289 [Enterococcus sp. 9E7_DIV0242]